GRPSHFAAAQVPAIARAPRGSSRRISTVRFLAPERRKHLRPPSCPPTQRATSLSKPGSSRVGSASVWGYARACFHPLGCRNYGTNDLGLGGRKLTMVGATARLRQAP